MGYDLQNEYGSGLRFNADGFREVIQLAMRGGWKPGALETVISALPQPSFAPKKVITVEFLLTEESPKPCWRLTFRHGNPIKTHGNGLMIWL
ncbi:MAG: hypothetical protein IPO91_17295 [Chloroflexi bacterium]|nr:hypothetical protein [Chloroflexota bacterium]